MKRGTTAVGLAAVLLPSCFSPGVSGPGFRWAPPEIRGVEWSARVTKLHGTLTVADEFHGNRVYIVHLPEARIVEHYLPFVTVLDACAIPGTDDAYVLLTDGRIVRTGEDLEGLPLFRDGRGCDEGSSIALSPDGSTIVLAARKESVNANRNPPFVLTLIDVASGRASALRDGLWFGRPCWAADGKSIFLVVPSGDIVQCSLAPGEPMHPVAHGEDPFVSEDGDWLIFHPREPYYREWNGTDWICKSTLLRWKVGTADASEPWTGVQGSFPEALAVSREGWIIRQTEADERLPREHSGLFMRAPFWRGGISLVEPESGATEPLFVGMIPTSVQWRWD